ncbi:hypothetical protein BO94DRAFT_585678 [Aspergillus sclerotioniger CBS 115572]|uniref:Uncharacterized protein n=1 Tax=Aspergillus sclerotioniger CBS 115572 TaxID=1450535 RepID=A0A317WSD4_9EURO|nr:hypothetical protein BO94DRAFT_585678 [Aspergillus sclerotioniger CBS 115572]PWY87110.1 hypothetical protein BO94DRAFT_585678 [Aspergillus sclerotioniger CBS 115572]
MDPNTPTNDLKTKRQQMAKQARAAKTTKHTSSQKKMENARKRKSTYALAESRNSSHPQKESPPNAEPSSPLPDDPIRSWIEDRMHEIHNLDLNPEIENKNIADGREAYKVYLEYYQLFRMLANDLVSSALKLRAGLFFKPQCWKYAPEDSRIWDIKPGTVVTDNGLGYGLHASLKECEKYEET